MEKDEELLVFRSEVGIIFLEVFFGAEFGKIVWGHFLMPNSGGEPADAG